jgi:hypothetical protein
MTQKWIFCVLLPTHVISMSERAREGGHALLAAWRRRADGMLFLGGLVEADGVQPCSRDFLGAVQQRVQGGLAVRWRARTERTRARLEAPGVNPVWRASFGSPCCPVVAADDPAGHPDY